MSCLTEDDIEALASVSANRIRDMSLDYLDESDSDPVDYMPRALASTKPSTTKKKKSSKDDDDDALHRSHELEQNTCQLISDYQNFLLDMDSKTEELTNLASNGNNGNGNGDGHDDEEHKLATKKDGMTCQTWDRSEPADLALATIPEDSSSPTSLWSAYPGIGYFDYYEEDRKQYDHDRSSSFRRNYRGCLILSVCVAIALLIIVPSLVGKKEQSSSQAANDTVSTQQQEQDSYNFIDYARDPVWYDRTKGWDGRTYLQAEQFCSAINGRKPCSYAAYCPGGKGKPPVGGVKDEHNGRSRWAPISNPPNEWVQVGKKDTCAVYSDLHGAWGTPNENDILLEVITRHVACCLRTSDNTASPDDGYPSDIYQRPPTLEEDDLTNSPPGLDYQPHWFNDSDGWAGTSYDDGVVFCGTMSMSVCPYRAYCPGGGSPFLGVQGKDAAEWLAPLWDSQPLWVGVGSINTCEQRGVLDESDKPKVKYILCCGEKSSENDWHNHEDENIGGLDPTITQSIDGGADEGAASKPIMQQTPITPQSESSDPLALTKNEEAAVEYMRPLWYGRKDGYVGSTHQEATDFCKSMDGRQLCLAEAYCPNGSPAEGELNPQPLFLKMNAFPSEQWAPISLNANSWLLVGIIDNNPAYTCGSYESVHDGAQPLWGFDGTQTEVKEHIMCCLIQEEGEKVEKESSDSNPP